MFAILLVAGFGVWLGYLCFGMAGAWFVLTLIAVWLAVNLWNARDAWRDFRETKRFCAEMRNVGSAAQPRTREEAKTWREEFQRRRRDELRAADD